MKPKPLADCWAMYAASVLPVETPENVHELLRTTFYAGAAALHDLCMNNLDDEDAGLAMLESVCDELNAQSEEMAKRCGVDLADVRRQIALDSMRGGGS